MLDQPVEGARSGCSDTDLEDGARRTTSVSEAYDAIAPAYDRQLDDDAWIRRILWKRYSDAFGHGQHVLDVGCGTGTDAVFLAQRGVRVTGIDISAAMIAEAKRKVAVHGLSDMVQLAVLDIRELASLPDEVCDGIISSFAVLNTLPTLPQFAADAARLLRPRGHMVLHLLNGSSLCEWIGLAAHGRWAEARQLRKRREATFRVGGQPVRHYMPRADEAYAHFFAPHFRLCRAYGLGITRPPIPPAYPRRGLELQELALEALGRLDELIGSRRPFVDWGRFVVLEMAKDGEP